MSNGVKSRQSTAVREGAGRPRIPPVGRNGPLLIVKWFFMGVWVARVNQQPSFRALSYSTDLPNPHP